MCVELILVVVVNDSDSKIFVHSQFSPFSFGGKESIGTPNIDSIERDHYYRNVNICVAEGADLCVHSKISVRFPNRKRQMDRKEDVKTEL